MLALGQAPAFTLDPQWLLAREPCRDTQVIYIEPPIDALHIL